MNISESTIQSKMVEVKVEVASSLISKVCEFGVCKFLGSTGFGKIFTEEFCSMVRTGTIVSGSGDAGHPNRSVFVWFVAN